MKKVLLFLVMTSIILGTSSCTKLPTGDRVSHVTLDKESLVLFVGEEAMLKPTVHPLTVSQSVSWQSDNNAVAVVDANGKVRGVSSGSTIIRATSVSGGRAGSCKVTVFRDYIENGVDYGHGIRFAGKVWAPVNCGYEPANSGKGYITGKYYQWGRKVGFGCAGEDATGATSVMQGPVSLEQAKSTDKFIIGDSDRCTWLVGKDPKLWNSGTEDAPAKTENDPCPSGWRVPTAKELRSLAGVSHNEVESFLDSQGNKAIRIINKEDGSEICLPITGNISSRGGNTKRTWLSGSDYYSSKLTRNDRNECGEVLKISYEMYGSSYMHTTEGCAYAYAIRCIAE